MPRFQPETQLEVEKKSDGFSECLITLLDPRSPASEAYRTLRTNLLRALVDNEFPRAIVVTSPGSKESKSAVCANLGVVLAEAGKNTLIMDCDLREPMMSEIFGIPDSQGIVDILAGECDPREVWQEPLPNLKVLVSGSVPPNPTELLESRGFSELFAGVREEFDYVLVDSSPAGMVPDPAILATQGAGILLVLNARKTRKKEIRRTVRKLAAARVTILGTVMDNLKKS